MREMILWVAAATAAVAVSAEEITGGRFYTVPEKVYVNEPFELRLELAATFGSEVEDLRIGGIPNDPGLLELGQMRQLSQSRESRDGRDVTVFRYAVSARGKKAFSRHCAPALSCSLVVRRNAGFFSHWQAYPQEKSLEPFDLSILALPEAGWPAGYTGAIGSFTLSGKLSQSVVRPGDIVTLTLTLAGDGWLGNGEMPAPAASPLFKSYPARATVSEPLRRVTEQAWIPNATNAAEIGAVRFPFFNPKTEKFEEAVAGPFRLTFSAASAAPTNAAVKVIHAELEPAAAQEGQPAAVTIDDVNRSVRHFGPLLAFAAAVLAAGFVFFALVGKHTVAGIALSVILIGAGGWAGHALSQRNARTATVKLAGRCDVRFAPSGQAVLLFSLNPGTEVTPLETSGAWTRIDAAGRRGWTRLPK